MIQKIPAIRQPVFRALIVPFQENRWQSCVEVHASAGVLCFAAVPGESRHSHGVKIMNDQNRVLSRQRARELAADECEFVSGGFITLSVCTAAPTPDGDQHPFEAGC